MPDIQRDMEAAWAAIAQAEEHGCSFALEGKRIAVSFPERIDPDVWRMIQFDVLENRLMIGKLLMALAEIKREGRQ